MSHFCDDAKDLTRITTVPDDWKAPGKPMRIIIAWVRGLERLHIERFHSVPRP